MAYGGSLQTTTGGRGRPVGNASINNSATASASQKLQSSGGGGSRSNDSSSSPTTATPGIIQAIKNAPNSPLTPPPTLPEFYAARRANNARNASIPPNNPTNAAIGTLTKAPEPAPYTSAVGYSTNSGYTLLYAKKPNVELERRNNDKEALNFFVRNTGRVGKAAVANAGTTGVIAGARLASPSLRRATSKEAVDRQSYFIAERAYQYTPEFLKSKDRIDYTIKESPTVGKTRTAQFVYGIMESPKNLINAPLPSMAKATKTGASLFIAGFGTGTAVNLAANAGKGAIAKKTVLIAGSAPLAIAAVMKPRETGREAPFIAVGAAAFGKGFGVASPPRSFTPTELQYVKGDARVSQNKISMQATGTVTGTLSEFGQSRIINIPATATLRGQRTGDTFYVKTKTSVPREYGGQKTYFGTYQPSTNRLLLRNKENFFFSETTTGGQRNDLLGGKNVNVAGTINKNVPSLVSTRKGFSLARSEEYNLYSPKILRTPELNAFMMGRPTRITQTESFVVTRPRPNSQGEGLFLRGSKDLAEKGVMQQPRVRQAEGLFRSRRGSLGGRTNEAILEPPSSPSRSNFAPRTPSLSGLPVAESFTGRNPLLLLGGFRSPSSRGQFQTRNIPASATTNSQSQKFQFDIDTRTTPDQIKVPQPFTPKEPQQRLSFDYGITTPAVLTPPITTPPPFIPRGGLGMPTFGIGGGGRSSGGGRRQAFTYTPSLTATLFNISGLRPSNPLGGFELRPLLRSRRRR